MMSGISPLAVRILSLLEAPVYFWQVIDAFSDETYRAILSAWSEVREAYLLDRDEDGRYLLKTLSDPQSLQ